MRLLSDENMPTSIGKLLVGHEVGSVVGLGWQGMKNGDLLHVQKPGFCFGADHGMKGFLIGTEAQTGVPGFEGDEFKTVWRHGGLPLQVETEGK